ncbi:MAG: hypothetical protein ACTSO6_08225 [Promethearchaeota archaeon]
MKDNLLLAILLMIYSIYLVITGWLYYKQEIEVLDIFSLPVYFWLRIFEGKDESEKWKKALFQTRNMKLYGKASIVAGIFGLALTIFICFY